VPLPELLLDPLPLLLETLLPLLELLLPELLLDPLTLPLELPPPELLLEPGHVVLAPLGAGWAGVEALFSLQPSCFCDQIAWLPTVEPGMVPPPELSHTSPTSPHVGSPQDPGPVEQGLVGPRYQPRSP
jgi:hypothetical protein